MAPGRVRRCHTDTGPWGFSHCTQHRLRGTQGGWPGPASDSAGGCGAMGCAFVKNPAGPPCAGHLTSPASLQGWGAQHFCVPGPLCLQAAQAWGPGLSPHLS